MVTLCNVIDTRTGKFHSEVIVKQRMARFFVPAEEEEDVIQLIDKENFEPGGTLEEVLQDAVVAVREEENTLSDKSQDKIQGIICPRDKNNRLKTQINGEGLKALYIKGFGA